jgi:spore coat polysaccharide biosynthesis protein SpsF
MNIVVVIQARMGSSRLPGKVMLPLAGEALLLRMVDRVRATRIPVTTLVATTTEPEDTDIRILCARHRIPCYSGDTYDLLDRHYRAALLYDADVVVKIPSDCPLIDPRIIEHVLAYYISHADRFDFVSNLHPPTWPDGNDVEVIPMRVLREAWKESDRQMEREHTTPFIWEQPERFRIGNVTWESGADFSMSHRWTIDYPEDYRFVRAVYDALYTDERPNFSLDDILHLLDQQPWISELNRRYAGVNWYRHHMHELRTIQPDRTRHADATTPEGKHTSSIFNEGLR